MPTLLWVCDYCGAAFKTEEDCKEHEKLCPNNPENKNDVVYNNAYKNNGFIRFRGVSPLIA